MAATDKVKEEGQVQAQPEVPKKSEGSGAALLILVILLIALLSVPLIVTRLNILGAGDKLRPYLKSDSAFSFILPPKKDPNDITTMNREELIKVNTDLKNKTTEIENQLKVLREISEFYTGTENGMEKFGHDRDALKAQAQQLEQQKTDLEKDKADFAAQVVNADPTGFDNYYKKIAPDVAKRLYQDVVRQQLSDEQVKAFVETYSKMDPDSAAKIFEQMAQSRVDTVVSILSKMDSGKASKILQAMDAKVAGRLTDILAKRNPISR